MYFETLEQAKFWGKRFWSTSVVYILFRLLHHFLSVVKGWLSLFLFSNSDGNEFGPKACSRISRLKPVYKVAMLADGNMSKIFKANDSDSLALRAET